MGWVYESNTGLWHIPECISSAELKRFSATLLTAKEKATEIENKKKLAAQKEAELQQAKEQQKLRTADKIRQSVEEEIKKREAWLAAEEAKEKENRRNIVAAKSNTSVQPVQKTATTIGQVCHCTSISNSNAANRKEDISSHQ